MLIVATQWLTVTTNESNVLGSITANGSPVANRGQKIWGGCDSVPFQLKFILKTFDFFTKCFLSLAVS